MADAQLSSPSYVKYAFTDQHNLVLLLGAACFSAAFASPVPLVVGASGELLWLLVGPRLPAFRDWVDARLSAQYFARAETAIQGAIAELSEPEAQRFSALSEATLELTSVARARNSLSAREVQLALHDLLELRRTFLDYQFLGQRVATLIDGSETAAVEREAARLQEEYVAERELTVRMTIRKALSIAQARLQQQKNLQVIQRSLELRLDMLEKILPLFVTRLADPAFTQLSQELEKSLAEVGSAETLELAVDETFEPAAAAASFPEQAPTSFVARAPARESSGQK